MVEDEWLIAESLADDLAAAGYAVVGPAHSIERARAALEAESVDAAILDIDLRGEKSFALAETLIERGIPFVFMSGYAETDLPAKLRSAPLVSKPVSRAQMASALNNMLPDGTSGRAADSAARPR